MYAIEEYEKAEILRDYLLENKSNYIIPGTNMLLSLSP
jgi:hypothetical protein